MHSDRLAESRLLELTLAVEKELDGLHDNCSQQSDVEFRAAVRRIRAVVAEINRDPALQPPALTKEIVVPMNAAVLSYVRAREAYDAYDRHARATADLSADPVAGAVVACDRARLLELSVTLRRDAHAAAERFRLARRGAAERYCVE